MIIALSRLLIFFISISRMSSGDASINVKCTTTKGDITIAVYPEWAPLGAAHFIELVNDNFYTDIALFRCVNKFLTQFGISDKTDKKHWHHKTIPDDPQNPRGIKKYYVSYAGGGKATRSTQLFIAFEDLHFLGKPEAPWEVAFGEIVSGHEVVDSFYRGNGDIPPFGKGPDQQLLHQRGNAYIREEFPHTDFIQQCSVLPDAAASPETEKIPPLDPMIIDLGIKSSGMATEKELNLRKQKMGFTEDLKVDRAEDAAARNSAMTAIVLLIIALFVLFCLYHYNSAGSSPKSQ